MALISRSRIISLLADGNDTVEIAALFDVPEFVVWNVLARTDRLMEL